MKALLILISVVLCLCLTPMGQPTEAVVSGPEACALCGENPLYCPQCWLWLALVTLQPENWQRIYE
jgi:hypothetical protein